MEYRDDPYRNIIKGKLWEPKMITRRQLLKTQGKWHLFLLNYAIYVSKIVEVPLYFLPNCILRWCLLNPMLKATQGTIDGVIMAMKKGFAINLSGGYHHAHKTGGGGFCVYNDITQAVQTARTHFGVKRAMVIDLDAH